MSEYSIKRSKRYFYIVYPDLVMKTYWDLFIGLILIISCCTTPYLLAFYNDNPDHGPWYIINLTFNIIFGIDIILSFISAYYNEDYYMIDQPRLIVHNYLRSWFIIDAAAIFPFQIFAKSTGGSINGIVRITRISRMWRLTKLTKLLRLSKVFKYQ